MKRTVILAIGLCALAAGSSASAARVHLVASPAIVSPGGLVTVGAVSSPCPVGDRVTLISAAFPGHAFGEGAVYGRVRSGGAFSVRTRIRTHLRAGRYGVTARCGGGTLGVSAFFRVR